MGKWELAVEEKYSSDKQFLQLCSPAHKEVNYYTGSQRFATEIEFVPSTVKVKN